MKKIFVLVCAAILSANIFAQNLVTAGVKEIRAAYAEAQAKVKAMNGGEAEKNKVVLVKNENVPGGGPTELRVEYFFDSDFQWLEEGEMYLSNPKVFLIRVSNRVGMLPAATQEYLVDKESGNLRFYFATEPYIDEDLSTKKHETRCYFDQSPSGSPRLLRKIEDKQQWDFKPENRDGNTDQSETQPDGSAFPDDCIFLFREFEQYMELFQKLPPFLFD